MHDRVRPMARLALALAIAVTLPAPAALAAAPPGKAVESARQTPHGLLVTLARATLRIEPWSERVIHVRASADPAWQGNYNPAVIARPQRVDWKISESAGFHALATPALQVRVDKATGAVSFHDPKGDPILNELPGSRRIAPGSQVGQGFALQGPVFGLGQHLNGLFDYTGNTVHLQQANRDVAVPMLVSPKGYGLLWNNASVTDVDAGLPATPHHPLEFRSGAGGGVDYHFIHGPEIDDIVAGYRELTGRAPMMARWTWGLWQSKERYKDQAELLGIAARYRQMKVPLDAVVQDWQYWLPGQWGSHEVDAARFPDPRRMLDALHAQNVHAIVSVWPRFDPGTGNAAELERAGALFPKTYDNVYPAGQGRWYDAYAPAGRKTYWDQIGRTLGRHGWDGWWLDGSEAKLGGHWGELREVRTAAGPGAEVLNAYPLLHTTGVYEGSRKDAPGKRPFILTRSAYSGQQRNAAVTWSGDTAATWDVFRAHIPAALNFTLSGIPYWSADIGGFFGGKPTDPDYAELYTRWYQFGAFNPMFRVHGTGAGKEIWQFDEATQDILRKYTELRYRLLPYIYSASADVTNRHGTMMRALMMDFRADRQALTVPDQYMFGKAIMVAPVTQARADVRTVYLPGSGAWFDFWSGQRHEAGKVIAAKAGIDTIPLFVRGGSILPLGPVVQHAGEKSPEPIEVRVYPGADGSYELYDDAGDGHGYLRGESATRRFTWRQAGGRLTIGPWQGSFPGLPARQEFLVRCGAIAGDAGVRVVADTVAVSVTLPECR
ncbi:glycoside hydrolase family 31 protein [Pseudoduganella sp. SL102]|uniref:glycoside hydrolase family 31 protein n=1 Tax=Pseudoduganella sp. SL102 TaxID=2995154 RepID=UPI00248B62C7|nr:glycoside hydrolase family 31 protein [Pseudoduganella sp. SL102]WBS05604.1 glycoside hydrolase family 31 protein [Pseudoduganella sp. SL102]